MSPHAAQAQQLLLVEDNPGDAELITDLLSDAPSRPHRVVHVTTLADAIACLRTADIDAVLLDLRLPDGSGVESVMAIRTHAAHVPIVVLTGIDDDGLALSCISAGAQDYLSKQEIGTTHLKRSIGYAIARVAERAEHDRAEALRSRLAAIVEASSDAIVSTTVDGVITSWNRGAERMFGHTSAEAIGRPAREILRPADNAALEQQDERIARVRDGSASTGPQELVRLRKDGSRVTLSAVSSNLRDAAGDVIGLAAICRDITEAKRRDAELVAMNAELMLRERQLRELAAKLDAVREDERTRISREVHDELGQLLTGLKMDLRWIGRRLEPSTPFGHVIAPKLAEAEALIDRTIVSVQRIALELRPSALDALGLAAALRDEARRFEKRTGVAAQVNVFSVRQPTGQVATALFRVFQELLTNVARHARAVHVRVTLDDDGDAWTLRVQDDGVGMPDVARHLNTSLGLVGISERLRAFGGTFAIESSEAQGTKAVARIPWPAHMVEEKGNALRIDRR